LSKEIEEIIRFQTDRDLDKKEFVVLNEQTSILEELLEMEQYNVPKEKRQDLKDAFELFKQQLLEDEVITEPIYRTCFEADHEEVDALADIIVFSIGALLKKEYCVEDILLEAGKEINSREGIMINGKFEKYVDNASKAKWYKADFTKCKMN